MENFTDMNINRLVGVLGTEWQLWRMVKGEEFYCTTLTSQGYTIPVVMSCYFFDNYAGRRVAVHAMPRETRRKQDGERMVFTYLYCVLVEDALEDEPDCRYVTIDGQVASKKGKVELGKGVETKIHFELRYVVQFDQPVTLLVPCRAFGRVARALCNLTRGENIKVEGHISGNGTSLKLRVQGFERYVLEEQSVPVETGTESVAN